MNKDKDTKTERQKDWKTKRQKEQKQKIERREDRKTERRGGTAWKARVHNPHTIAVISVQEFDRACDYCDIQRKFYLGSGVDSFAQSLDDLGRREQENWDSSHTGTCGVSDFVGYCYHWGFWNFPLTFEFDKGRCHLRFSGIRPLRGYPPPALTENQCEKKKVFFLSGKGGYPPPLNGKSAKLFREIFS